MPAMWAQAESLMLDSGRAFRRSGEPAYDPEEQASTVPEVELFASRCKVKPPDTQDRTIEVAGRTAVVVDAVLHLPVSTEPLTAGDEWLVEAVDPLSAARAGRRYRVLGPVERTWATARRYQVEEVLT